MSTVETTNPLCILIADIHKASVGAVIEIKGWLRTKRDSKGGFSFLEINDGSCAANIQVIANATLENYQNEIIKTSVGCSLAVVGVLKESIGKGQAIEIEAQSVEIVGSADSSSYPLQKKRHSTEKLREWSHLRSRTSMFSSTMRVRGQISKSIHDFFEKNRFLNVHTPIITTSDCEGAGQMFRATTNHIDRKEIRRSLLSQDIVDLRNVLEQILDGAANPETDFFGQDSFLTVSGQLEAEMLACGLGRVYTFGPTFRAENSNTSRHLSEFWMVEPEAAFFDLNDNMELAENFLKYILRDVLNKNVLEMKTFAKHNNKNAIDRLEAIVETEFERIEYTEAIEILMQSDRRFDFKVDWGIDLQAEHERYLTDSHFGSPIIVYNYPIEIKPFYMYRNEDDATVRAMDVLVPGVGEIIGGSQREHRLESLSRRIVEANLNPVEYASYIELREFGTVPHSGFGLGLERLVQFVTATSNIRDVIPFPRTPGRARS